MNTMFRDLEIGDTFDFINDNNDFKMKTYNGIIKRCKKISPKCYISLGTNQKYKINSIDCYVFNVERIKIEED